MRMFKITIWVPNTDPNGTPYMRANDSVSIEQVAQWVEGNTPKEDKRIGGAWEHGEIDRDEVYDYMEEEGYDPYNTLHHMLEWGRTDDNITFETLKDMML